MFKKINTFLENNFHIKIVRSKPLSFAENGNGNNIIEFVGPSAIGKTTLCNYYLKNHKVDFGNNLLIAKDLIPYRHHKVKLTGIHEVLFSERVNTVRGKSSGSSKFNKIFNFYAHLKNDFIITKHFDDKSLILDEHLIHSFPELPEVLQELDVHGFLENRLFINCSTSVENLVRNVRTRLKKGTADKGYQGVSESELYETAERRIAIKNRSAQTLRNIGAAVLDVDTANDMDENVKLIDAFLENYMKNISEK